MSIRVLMLSTSLNVCGGVSSFVMNYFRSIDHNEVHMDFAIWKDIHSPYYKEIEEAGSQIYVLPPISKVRHHINECKKIIRNGGYDVVHDSTLIISLPIMYFAKRYNVPVRIFHSHNSKIGETFVKKIRNGVFLPLLKETANNFAACSRLAGTTMFGYNKKFELIPNIILDHNFCFSMEKRRRIREMMSVQNKVVIGSVGRLALQKNPLFALEVIRVLLKKYSSIEYWWIGSGPLDEVFSKRIFDLGLEEKVKLLGIRNDMSNLYQAMDILFMPSEFEGNPLAAIEAQAMGLPCVLSNAITDEVCFTDLVTFVNLNSGYEICASVIEEQMSRIVDRRSYQAELGESLYSGKNAGSRLYSLYEKMLREKKRMRMA